MKTTIPALALAGTLAAAAPAMAQNIPYGYLGSSPYGMTGLGTTQPSYETTFGYPPGGVYQPPQAGWELPTRDMIPRNFGYVPEPSQPYFPCAGCR